MADVIDENKVVKEIEGVFNMDGTAFVGELNKTPDIEPNKDLFSGIWEEYEKVIMHSLITSFGLDFLVQDQFGGDVDTIHNVRQIHEGGDMQYKNAANKVAYDNKGDYDTRAYHSHETFRSIKQEARGDFDNNGTMLNDAYVPGNVLIPRNNNTIPREHQAQLDHVMSAHEIHNDRGRVLSGLSGEELANNPENLRFTNADLNLNKRDMTVEEYIQWCEDNPSKVNQGGKKGEPLSEDVKAQLRREYNRAKKQYDAKVAKEYYRSPEFIKDTASAANKRGMEMAARQVLGLVFVEVWLSAKAELMAVPTESSLEDMINAVGRGIKIGFEKAKDNHKELLKKFVEGYSSGALASLTTTLCNIFFTTSKNLVRYIRQIYAFIVQAGNVLLFNPNNQMLGDRIKTTAVILASGASVVAGTAVGTLVTETPVGQIPKVGSVVVTFCSSMVSGLLSCSFLVFLDRSKFINDLIDRMNEIPSDANNYREIADAMESLAAKIANLDIEKFKEDTKRFESLANDIMDCDDENSLNTILKQSYEKIDIDIPWKGDFDSFMSDKENKLVFG